MTAVAPLQNAHTVPRGWGGGGQGLDSMAAEIFVPRNKGSQQRYSMPSSVSSTSTASAENAASNGGWSSLTGKKKNVVRGPAGASALSNGVGGGAPGGVNVAGPWSKNDPNLSHQRAVSGPGQGLATSAAGAVNGAHQPGPILPSQHLMNGPLQQNGSQQQSYLMLLPLNATFERKSIPLPSYPETLRIGRQTNAKTIPTPSNGYFDSKVLSRQHAEVWSEKATGRVWIRDIKSSNGTFVNGQRLSQENQESEPHELRAEDVLELGIDIVGEDNKTIVHHKVAARVEHAGLHGGSGNGGNFDLNFGDLDPIIGGSLMNPPINHGQAQNSLRGRTGSQGSRQVLMNGPNGLSAMNGHRPAPMMIAPVTMEMVVKKLNFELQAAKIQSQDLQRTADVFDFVLSSPNSSSDDVKSPNENISHESAASKPAFAPLQSKPTTELSRPASSDVSSLRSFKSDKSTKADKPDPPQQLLSLVDALAKARKEVESKSMRVSDLEEALKKERIAREVAEDRAAQLENASRALKGKSREKLSKEETEKKQMEEEAYVDNSDRDSVNTVLDREPDIDSADTTTTDPSVSVDTIAIAAAEAANMHHKRMEEMILELKAAHEQIDEYRRRAETAEKERESSRKTLAEMVQKIRDEEEARKSSTRENSNQTDVVNVQSLGIQVDATSVEEEKGRVVTNGHADHGRDKAPRPVVQVRGKGTALLPRTEATPYASLFGVMIIGVGLMAVLNGWQRGER